jgi:hypothetical protein
MRATRRVRKEEIRRETVAQKDPLDLCLECWKDWIAGDADRDLKAKTMGGLTGNTDGYGSDLYEAQQARNNEIAAATDAMIESLSPLHRWAIYRLCSVSTPWEYPNADLLTVGPAAQKSLTEKLMKNSCTRMLF